MRRARAACAGLIAALLGGCSLITDSFLSNDFSGDAFPINIDTSTGAIVVAIHAADAPPDDVRDAVLDLLSPITVIDPGPMTTPSASYADLLLLGQSAPGATDRVARARFPDAQLVALHPCADTLPTGGPNPDCIVGVPDAMGVAGAIHHVRGIVGADVLAGDAVRLRLAENQLFVLADIGGSDRGRTLDCDAVFNSPYRGGGTLVIAGTELPFGNRRITVRACLGPDPEPDPQPTGALTPDGSCPREMERKAIADSLRQRGADALFVVSTSIGVSILSATAYQRYQLVHPEATALDALVTGSVYLPSGLVQGRRATIDRVALVAASISNALAPCRQLYAHRLLSALGPIESSEFDACRDPMGNPAFTFPSPCKDGSTFCPVPAALEVTQPTGIDVLVVDDTDPTLQALRTELRPDQPEVDGILGTQFFRGAEIDADYPHDRLLARCRAANCVARPQLAQDQPDRCQINRCITGAQMPPGCSGP